MTDGKYQLPQETLELIADMALRYTAKQQEKRKTKKPKEPKK